MSIINIRKGFTLIELLVTISIIGILVGIAAFALQGGQRSGRDAKRKSDLEQIRSGLEYYRSTCLTYPPALGSTLVGSGVGSCTGTFMEIIPQDSASPARKYSYIYDSASKNYKLCAALEDEPVPAMTLSQLNGCGSCGTGGFDCNYVVTSP